jgi:serine/threonine-protein kinase RsbT
VEGSGFVSGAPQESGADDDLFVDLVPVVRRVVGSRIRDPHVVDDLVQETLVRVMAARSRVGADALVPYAATTARNLVVSHFHGTELARRKAHLLADDDPAAPPIDGLLEEEDKRLLAVALQRLPPGERELLVAHEVEGQDTKSLAARRSSTPGAVAAQLSRSRAKLRVEYLLVRENTEPETDRCRPVLRALSSGDRRRQRELDAAGHVLECECCTRVSAGLLDRRASPLGADEVRISVEKDADVVQARQRGREVAVRLGFSPTEATLLATAISEMARNIVKFAVRGQVVITEVTAETQQGITIVVRDVGPGIPDIDQAMLDGFSTYNGLGLGLPGARRLMDEFEVVSEAGRGTTVTMTKWRSSGSGPDAVRDRTDRDRERTTE